jgi:RimJ/RimL family protein N-acetyltransferase
MIETSNPRHLMSRVFSDGASMPDPLRTDRLLLIPASAALFECELAGAEALAYALDAVIGDEWSTFAILNILPMLVNQLRDCPENASWFPWYWLRIDADTRELIGSGGFKGPPDDLGQVQVGYEVLGSHQGNGFATEAVAALVGWALGNDDVDTVVAECLPNNPASIRVLQKCGFVEVGDGLEKGTRLWEISK